jgi:xanthine dehydrogenase YagT iron-sulfur-binding subunit
VKDSADGDSRPLPVETPAPLDPLAAPSSDPPPPRAGRFAATLAPPPPPQSPPGLDRRVFLGISLGALPAVRLAGTGLGTTDSARAATETGQPPPTPASPALTPPPPAASPAAHLERLVAVALQLNGQPRELRVDPRASLLDALREDLALDGTKKGCDHGQCGACTVLLDGRRVLSCLTLAAAASKHRVTTIEGLGEGDRLHPVQAAFLAHDAFQCGYCTPGQILSAVGLLAEGCPHDAAAIREQMSGNLCRCGAYPNIVAAIQQAQAGRTA